MGRLKQGWLDRILNDIQTIGNALQEEDSLILKA